MYRILLLVEIMASLQTFNRLKFHHESLQPEFKTNKIKVVCLMTPTLQDYLLVAITLMMNQ